MSKQSLTPDILKEKSELYKSKVRKYLERANNDSDVIEYIIDVIGMAFDAGHLSGELEAIEKLRALSK